MSYDPSSREYKITVRKEYIKDVLKVIENINKNNGGKLQISFVDDTIEVLEPGWYKYGFTSTLNFNYKKFIEDIIMCDKENTKIIVSVDGYLEDDSYVYFYENGEIVQRSYKYLKYETASSKEEKIEIIKKDFSYFMNLSDEEKKDFDYQMASLEVDYPVYTWEFGSDDCDALYSEEFLDREETVRAIFKFGNRFNLFNKRIKDKYKNDEKLMKELLPLRPRYIAALPDKFKEDKELVLKLINNANSYDEISLSDISPKFRNDKKVMLNFIKKNSYNISLASKRLKADYDICKVHILCGGSELESIDNKEILDDKELILKVLDGFSNKVDKISERLKSDPKVLSKFIANQVLLNEKSYYTKTNKKKKEMQEKLLKMTLEDMIKYGIENDRYFYQSIGIIPKKILYNKEFIEYLIEKNKKRERYCYFKVVLDKKLYEDKEFVNSLIERKIEYTLDDEIKYNKKEIIKNFDNYVWEYEKMPENLKNDIDVIKKYVEFSGYNISKLDKKYLKDEEIRKIALENYTILGMNNLPVNATEKEIKKKLKQEFGEDDKKLEYLNTITNYKREDLLLLVKSCGGLLIIHGKKYLDDKEMILNAIKSYPRIYEVISDRLKNDKEIIIEGLNSGYLPFYESLSDEIKEDDEITKLAIKRSWYNIQFAPEKYKNDEKIIKKSLSNLICMRSHLNEFIGDKLKDNEEFMLHLCNKKLKTRNFDYFDCRKYYNIASKRLLKSPDFISKVFGIKEGLSIVDTYIELLHLRNKHNYEVITSYETPKFEFLMKDVKYLKELALKHCIINNIEEYSKFDNIEDLTLEIYMNSGFEKGDFFTDEIMKSKSFVTKLLTKFPEYVDGVTFAYDKSKDRIITNFENDEDIMKLYKVEEILEKNSMENSFLYKPVKEDEEDEEEEYVEKIDEDEIDVDSYPYDDSDVTDEDLEVSVKKYEEDDDWDSELDFFDF